MTLLFAALIIAQGFLDSTPVGEDQGLEFDSIIEEQSQQEKLNTLEDESENQDFFDTPDKNRDRNPYYFPNSTIEKNL